MIDSRTRATYNDIYESIKIIEAVKGTTMSNAKKLIKHWEQEHAIYLASQDADKKKRALLKMGRYLRKAEHVKAKKMEDLEHIVRLSKLTYELSQQETKRAQNAADFYRQLAEKLKDRELDLLYMQDWLLKLTDDDSFYKS